MDKEVPHGNTLYRKNRKRRKEVCEMKKRKLAALFTCAALTLSMFGCGGSSSSPAASSAADESSFGTATSVTWWMDPQNLSSNQAKSFDNAIEWQ